MKATLRKELLSITGSNIMRRSIFIVLLMTIFMVASVGEGFTQDTIQPGDSLLLQLDVTDIGEIQWQESADGFDWSDIPDAISSVVKVEMPASAIFFRARISGDDCDTYHTEIFEVNPGEAAQVYRMKSVSGSIEANIDLEGYAISTFYNGGELDVTDASFQIEVPDSRKILPYIYLTNVNEEVILIGMQSQYGTYEISPETTAEVIARQFLTFSNLTKQEKNNLIGLIRNESEFRRLVEVIEISSGNETSIYASENNDFQVALDNLVLLLSEVLESSSLKSTMHYTSTLAEDDPIQLTASVGQLTIMNVMDELALVGEVKSLAQNSSSSLVELPSNIVKTTGAFDDDIYTISLHTGFRSILGFTDATEADDLALELNAGFLIGNVLEMVIGELEGVALSVDLMRFIRKGGAGSSSCSQLLAASLINGCYTIVKNTLATKDSKSKEDFADAVLEGVQKFFTTSLGDNFFSDENLGKCIQGSALKLISSSAIDFFNAYKKVKPMFLLTRRLTLMFSFNNNEYGPFQLHYGLKYPAELALEDMGTDPLIKIPQGTSHSFEVQVVDGKRKGINNSPIEWKIGSSQENLGTSATTASGLSTFSYMADQEPGRYFIQAFARDKEGDHIGGSPLGFNIEIPEAQDSTEFYQAAVLGAWTASNLDGMSQDSPYDFVLYEGGNGAYVGQGGEPFSNNRTYPIYWYIDKKDGQYFLYETNFWHSGYLEFEVYREPLSNPLTGFDTYGDIGNGVEKSLVYRKQ
jgi:hypothetical protein